MYYISLDEQGDFENLKGEINKAPVFIAGVIYDGNDEEVENEKKRIETYLKTICEENGGKYPAGLHSNGKNNALIRKTKTAITKSLEAFFHDDDYPGKDTLPEELVSRKGKYYLYIHMKGENGKELRKSTIPAGFMRDDYAGNLYVHMADDVIDRLLFHTPEFKVSRPAYSVDLATRKVCYFDLSEGSLNEKLNEFEKLGIDEYVHNWKATFDKEKNRRRNNKGKYDIAFDLTNSRSYVTSIERAALNDEADIELVDFNVRSIYYDDESSSPSQCFLFMADIICNYLSYKLEDKAYWYEEIQYRLEKLVGDRSFFYLYDDVDSLYGRALKMYEQKNYYEALGYLYDAEQLDSNEAVHYKKYLIRNLKESMCKDVDVEQLYAAISRMSDFSYSNIGKREKLLYIYKNLEKIYQSVNKKVNPDEWGKYSFELFDVGVSAYTHMGDGINAEACYKRVKEFSRFVGLDKNIISTNKMIVFMQDRFEYDKALDEARLNFQYASKACKALRTAKVDIGPLKKIYAISASQYGQIASVKAKDKARDIFESALKNMQDDEANYLITLSYYLHFLIENGKMSEYKIWAKEYFGSDKKKDQLTAVLNEYAKNDYRRYYPDYALYIYIKALDVFAGKKIPEDIVEPLRDIDKTLKSVGYKKSRSNMAHPWELIYKHLALIFAKLGDLKTAQMYIDKGLNKVKKSDEQIIDAIIQYSNFEYYSFISDEVKSNMYLSKYEKCLSKINPEVYAASKEKGMKERIAIYKELMQYMYN